MLPDLRAPVFLLAASVLLASCSLTTAFDELSSPTSPVDAPPHALAGSERDAGRAAATSGPAPDGSRDAGGDASALDCPARGGPSMVRVRVRVGVPVVQGSGASYCIDSTEVTRGQYQRFLASDPPASTHPRCAYRKNHEPSWSLEGEELPVLGVDWCDAHAFCAWAGKRLCGRIGGGAQGTPNAATASEWVNACSAGGSMTYPYGNVFDPLACSTGIEEPADVGSRATCQGGVDGVFDMSGNVAEWGEACDVFSPAESGDTDSCVYFNSNFSETFASDLRCSKTRTAARSARTDIVGIRCCAP